MESTGGQENGLNATTTAEGVPSGKPTVCFLGPVASYTHQATLDTFPTDQFDLVPVETIKDIFDTTQSGRASYGVVPFENSTNGSVVFTLDHFADRAGEYPDLSVCAEIYLDVHHCLLGHPPPPSPSSSPSQFSHIKRIYSHPQAFGQCRLFLQQRLPKNIETVDVSSTSRAAELALADPSGASAAVSSAAAAKLVGLQVLARDIEDRKDNTTRFFVLRRGFGGSGEDGVMEELLGRRSSERERERAAPDSEHVDTIYATARSLASFTLPLTSRPGALADVLECFRRARLNLTSISSRPSLAAPFQYVFFVEFEGHLHRDPEGRVADALESLPAGY
ncbi:PDT-domain-containing protein [Hypoxylon fragiforme]|uniref:PDT-domain-containing protein n=1 Tax=Hypoxylon fragiforme TaxID=63214 RepID=UPI0020C67520|nr:PDT-domain-containing protein [Hypoxylon fragiforme]KAI2612128.1 PDT-domain-containing protein [Hypoxylon fragiforme]